jgi:CubicO group peptidase (beta-lactamase class C family)
MRGGRGSGERLSAVRVREAWEEWSTSRGEPGMGSAVSRTMKDEARWERTMGTVRRRFPLSGLLFLFPGLLFPFLTLACGGSGGQEGSGEMDPGLRAADSLVAAAVASRTVPGAVLLVARHGEVLLERGYGHAQLMELPAGLERVGGEENPYSEPPIPLSHPPSMTAATAFDLASVTKVMATTMAVMLLVDRGQVELEAPVRAYLPEFAGKGKDSVTVRNLLTHSAGLAQWQPLYYSAGTGEEAFRVIQRLPLSWGVGEARHYSDLGFMLLGYLVERLAGEPLDRFLARELYGPLGLRRTGFRRVGCEGRPEPEESRGWPAVRREASESGTLCPSGPFAATSHGNPYEWRMVHDSTFGYRYLGDPGSWNGWRRYTLVGEVNDGNAFHAHGGVAGHAGLFSTAAELHRLLELLLNGGVAEGRRFFREETVSLFLAPTEFGQALGWQTPSWAPGGSFSHTGFTGTFVLGIPYSKMAVVLLTNRQNLGVGDDTRYPELGDLQRQVVLAVSEGVDQGGEEGSGG